MLMEIPVAMPVGTRLELSMDWTGLYHGKQKMRLVLLGWVTRVDENGTAVRFVRHQFRDVSPVESKLRVA